MSIISLRGVQNLEIPRHDLTLLIVKVSGYDRNAGHNELR
jgi:hypothetical protein